MLLSMLFIGSYGINLNKYAGLLNFQIFFIT